MKELKEAQMGIIAVLALMLVSIKRRLPTRKLSSGITTLALAGIVLLVAAGSVSAADCGDGIAPCQCGDTVMADWTFTGDMVCTDSTKPGLIIGASNIVIDGDGFKMTGNEDASACSVCYVGTGGSTSQVKPARHSGIINAGGFDNVVIKDLEIENFCTGIAIGDTMAPGVLNNTVTKCKIHHNGNGTAVGMVTHGIHLVGASRCSITKNEISNNNGTGDSCGSGGNGIFVHGAEEAGLGGDENNITCNNLTYNAKSGFFMKFQCMRCIISYNKATNNGEGGIVPKCEKSNFNTFEYNTMIGNTVWGFYTNGNDNTIRYNTIKDTPGIGLELGAKAGETGNNVVTNNCVCNNGQDIVSTLATNTGDENTCGNGPAGWCDWNCDNNVPVYYDFDQDGYYSNTTANCTCDNIAGGTCACCNPGLFAVAGASQQCAGGFCKYDGNGDDPNDCNNSIKGEQKPDYIVTAVDIEWLLNNDSHYNVTYTVKNDGDAAATSTSSNSIATGYSSIKNGTPALGIGESSSGEVGPFACGGPNENLTDSITVCADCDVEIGESNEGNNCGSVPTVTCRWPDYRIIDKYETWIDEDTKTYNITYLICNNGTRNGTKLTTTKVAGTTGSQPDKNVPKIVKGECIWRVAQDQNGAEWTYIMNGPYDTITLTANRGSGSPWMTELNQFNNSITNTFYGNVVVSLDPLHSTVSANPGTTTVNITLSNVEDYGSGTISLYYDPTVLEVDSYGPGQSADVVANIFSSPATPPLTSYIQISASYTSNPGLSGDVRFATVTFKPAACGNPGDCSDLNLTVQTLYDRSYEALATMTTNGSMCVKESDQPVVSAAMANPDCILNNTPQMRARVPGTNETNLSVHVTDATNVNSVYVNLMPIGGGAMQKMDGPDGQKEGDWWWNNTHADYSSLTPYCLTVMAKDHHGNWNNDTCINLVVRRRGDMVGNGALPDNDVDMADYNRIAMYTVGLLPEPDKLVAGIVPADAYAGAGAHGTDMADALYIAMYSAFSGPPDNYPAP